MDDVTQAINHFSVLMEDQNAKLDAVLEGQKDQATRADINRLEQRLDALVSDVQTIKAGGDCYQSRCCWVRSPRDAARGGVTDGWCGVWVLMVFWLHIAPFGRLLYYQCIPSAS
jgi:hypothetical protein